MTDLVAPIARIVSASAAAAWWASPASRTAMTTPASSTVTPIRLAERIELGGRVDPGQRAGEFGHGSMLQPAGPRPGLALQPARCHPSGCGTLQGLHGKLTLCRAHPRVAAPALDAFVTSQAYGTGGDVAIDGFDFVAALEIRRTNLI